MVVERTTWPPSGDNIHYEAKVSECESGGERKKLGDESRVSSGGDSMVG